MEVESVQGAAPSEYRTIPKENWQRFFDAFTKVVARRVTEIEVIALALGDQIEAEWVPLAGLSYDPHADTFYVFLEEAEAHAIANPRDIVARFTGQGLEQIALIGGDDVKHVIRLRDAVQLQLPSTTG